MISRYITLEEIMRRFSPEFFLAKSSTWYYLAGCIAGSDVKTMKLPGDKDSEQVLDHWRTHLLDMAEKCRDQGLTFSALALDRLGHNIELVAADAKELRYKVEAAFDGLGDEIGLHTFFAIEQDKMKFLSEVNPCGDICSMAFPSTDYDAMEAGKCIVFDRWTASVMHSMRVLEVGLKTLAVALGIPMKSPNWQDLINQIESKIKDKRTTDQDWWRAEGQFHSEAAVQFQHFKNAWRNHAMRGPNTYDEERAIAIFNHVKEFMSHLATKLKE